MSARSLRRPLLAWSLLASLGACTPSEVTYWRDVKPILSARCEGCHTAGGSGPFDLSTAALAAEHAGSIVAMTASGKMPPWMPAPTIAYRDDRRLSDEELQTLRTWAETGAREGERDDYVPPDRSSEPRIAPKLEVAMKAPYQPDLSLGADDYRCFVLDPELSKDVAVTGFDIRPGDRRVVHHVIVYAVKEAQFEALQRREDEDADEGYTCFGTARVASDMVGAWVPGTTATVFPSGTGIVLAARSKLVVQVHYNTLETKDAVDLTTVLLETVPASSVKPALIYPILDDSFSIAPGVVGGTKIVFDTRNLGLQKGTKVKLHGAVPHMHLHGKSISVEVEKPDGSKHRVMDIPKWDFHWQQMYFYKKPFELAYGDLVTLECVWDNREHVQPIVNGRQIEAQTLRWGEGTLEEMCLNFFYVTN